MIPQILEESRIKYVINKYTCTFLDPIDCIRKSIDEFGDKLAVLWSGGRCSTIVLHMTLKFYPDVKVIFNDTGVEFPETYEFIDLLEKKWNLNLIRTKPIKSFWECVKEYGFPMFRDTKRNHKHYDRPKCCIFLKEKPTEIAQQKFGIEACILGTRASESRVRTFVFAKTGQSYFVKSRKRWNICPIAIWTTRQVLDYEKRFDIPHCKAYDKGQERLGCWPCTGFHNWQENLAKSHPKLYKFLKKEYEKNKNNLSTNYEEDILQGCRQVLPETFI